MACCGLGAQSGFEHRGGAVQGVTRRTAVVVREGASRRRKGLERMLGASDWPVKGQIPHPGE